MTENEIQTIARDILADDDFMGDLKTFARECIRLKGERDAYKDLLDRAMSLLQPDPCGYRGDDFGKLIDDVAEFEKANILTNSPEQRKE